MSNPALNENTFGYRNPFARDSDDQLDAPRGMTYAGTGAWLLFFSLILAGGFSYSWQLATKGFEEKFAYAKAHPEYKVDEKTGDKKQLPVQIEIPGEAAKYAVLGCFGGLVVGFIIIGAPASARFLGPVYALCEGLALGAISAGFEAKYPGIAFQAGGSTVAAVGATSLVYLSGIVRVNDKFLQVVTWAGGALLCLYLVNLASVAFGGGYIRSLGDTSTLSFCVSGFAIVVGCAYLMADMELVKQGVQQRAPKHMEAYCAFGSLVTLVWLYIEILELLAKLRGSDD